MKRSPSLGRPLWLAAIASLLLPALGQAINLGSGAVSFDFTALPSPADFSTHTLGIGGASSDFQSVAALDVAIQQLTATGVFAALPSTSSTSTNAAFRHNASLGALQSRMTGTGAGVLLARLENTGPNYITDLGITYGLSVEGTGDEELPFHCLYFSVTGLANS